HFDNAVALVRSQRIAEAQSESALALHLARKHGNELGEASALAQLGRCKVERGQLVEGLADLRKAEQDALKASDDEAKAQLLAALAICYRAIGLLSKASVFFEHALRICRSSAAATLAMTFDCSVQLARTYMFRNRGRDDLAKAEIVLTD